jgi:glycosyltransferase involved in cell wall biosynthesis
MPKAPLTVLIPTFNEARNLPDCISSIRAIADEILVVDSFSSDSTPELAVQLGAKLLQHEYVNSAAQKNWAIPQCRHNWVFIIDADERATPELAAEITEVLSKVEAGEADLPDGWFVGRRTFFLGGEIAHGGWESNDVQRLFRKALGRYAEREVHADVALAGGRSGKLKGKLLHYTCTDLNLYFQKFNRYTTQAAERYFREGRRAHWYDFLFRPWWEFSKMYLLKLGFLDGTQGFLLAMFCAMTRFVRYAKLWSYELCGRSRSESYDICTRARDIDGAASKKD